MTAYLLIKWLHVLFSVVLVGTGFGTAYFMFFANRSDSVAAQAVVALGAEVPDLYWRYARRWEWLSCPAFVAMLAVFYLMVAKPVLFAN